MKKILLITVFCTFISLLNAQKSNHKIEASIVTDTIETLVDSGYLTLRVYPNPFNTIINIEYKNKHNTISVYDISGKIIFECKNESDKIQIDLSKQKCGTYFLRLEKETIKIIKQ